MTEPNANNDMRLLVAYDGSADADAAIDDLYHCGLPALGTAEIISIADVWLPPAGANDHSDDFASSEYLEEVLRSQRERGKRAVVEAETLARFAQERVRNALPGWTVQSYVTYGSPGWEIVNRSAEIGADLIIVGARGHTMLSRFVLGSISQKVITEAACSVRVGRGRNEVDRTPDRIVIGFDGSAGAAAAVDAVASRSWNRGGEVRLISVIESVASAAISRFVSPMAVAVAEADAPEKVWLENLAAPQLRKLEAAGLAASMTFAPGSPKRELITEAEKWGADSIYVGANAAGGRLEKFLLGSTAATVAAGAHCSVEIVRTNVVHAVELEKRKIAFHPAPLDGGGRAHA